MRKPELVKAALKRKMCMYRCPERKTKYSAGYDFYCPEEVVIPPNGTVLIATGYKLELDPEEVMQIYIRSSLAMKRDLAMTNGVGIIDADYYNNPDNEGEILIGVRNMSSENPAVIQRLERFAQGIVYNYHTWGDYPSELRVGGVGSTNKEGEDK